MNMRKLGLQNPVYLTTSYVVSVVQKQEGVFMRVIRVLNGTVPVSAAFAARVQEVSFALLVATIFLA